MSEAPEYVLVTGATGFIGAHVVDALLSRGLRVRGATRSLAKGKAMIRAREKYASRLDFVVIGDFEKLGVFKDAVKDIEAVIHVASPFTYDTENNEKELVIPAVNGVHSILDAAAESNVKRIVITSSFAAVLNVHRKAPPYFTYTADDWNPLNYEESVDPATSAVIAYRGSKKFAELAAWDFVRAREHDLNFDIVTLCPPMTFGPVVHPVSSVGQLNESNAMLWRIATGHPPPVARVPFWIDVRDLAVAHVEALLRPGVGNSRFIPASPERFSYGLAAKIMAEEFDWATGVVQQDQTIDESHGIDGENAAKALGLTYRTFRETTVDLISQAIRMDRAD